MMQTKLTLRLEDRLVKRAKDYARRTGKSLSRMVADFFVILGSEAGDHPAELTPTVRSLKGALRGGAEDREGYRRHLEEKYR
jgi:hypothetical protein